jgi:hypothetical protein
MLVFDYLGRDDVLHVFRLPDSLGTSISLHCIYTFVGLDCSHIESLDSHEGRVDREIRDKKSKGRLTSCDIRNLDNREETGSTLQHTARVHDLIL